MSFLGEIKRRKVFQVAAVYVVVAWLIMQVVDVVNEPLSLPGWFDTVVILFLGIGFPIALILSWAFDMTAEGLVRDEGRRATGQSGHRIEYILASLLVIAVGWIGYRELGLSSQSERQVMSNSVAVLPCDNLSPDPDNAYFAAGLHEEILNRLAKLSDLNVIARTSVLQYAAAARPLPEIAGELNVESIMVCSVSYADDRVAISAQLIDGQTGAHLWSERYYREFRDVFGIQADIATNVASALEAEFSVADRENIANPSTDSTEAYALYLKGRYFWNIRSEEAMERALGYYQQAREIDPVYTLAYVGIADVWIFRGWYSVLAPNEAYPKAKAAITEALAINTALAEPHASLGLIHFEFDHDWDAAETEFLRAIAIDPRYAIAHHWYGGYLSAMGRHDEALAQAQQARDLDPLSLIINTWVGLRHYFAGRYAMSIETYRAALDLNPDFAPAHWHLGWAYEQIGDFDAAISSAERAFEITDNPIYLASLGHAHAKAGNEQDARRVLDQLERIATARHVSAYHVAAIHAALGEIDDSFEWLERAYAEQSPWIGYMQVDPRMDPLRSDPRYGRLSRRARLDF